MANNATWNRENKQKSVHVQYLLCTAKHVTHVAAPLKHVTAIDGNGTAAHTLTNQLRTHQSELENRTTVSGDNAVSGARADMQS